MARIRFTRQAQDELEAVIEYYERIGAADFATVFEGRVLEKINGLKDFPRVGRIVPEIQDGAIREVIYRNFRTST